MAKAGKRLFGIEDALCIRTWPFRSSFQVSPDGEHLAYTLDEPHRCERLRQGKIVGRLPSGVPWLAAGGELWVQHHLSAEPQLLTPEGATDWCPAWSPNSQFLAFYSDRTGQACLWLWDLRTSAAHPLCDQPIHSIYGNETPQWTSDGAAVLVKVDSGISPGQADGFPPSSASAATNAAVPIVWDYDPSPIADAGESASRSSGESEWPSHVQDHRGVLALIRVESGAVKIITPVLHNTAWALSPDGRDVALLSFVGYPSASDRMPLWDLLVVTPDMGESRRLVERIPQSTGNSLSWSPDSRWLAYTDSSAGDLLAAPVDGGPRQSLAAGCPDRIIPRYTESAPAWMGDSRRVLWLHGGQLWLMPVNGSAPEKLCAPNGRHLTGLAGTLTIGTDDLLATTRDPTTKREGFCHLSLQDGRADMLYEAPMRLGAARAHHAGGETAIYFAMEDAATPPDIWRADATFKRREQVTRLNPNLDGRTFGATQVVEWVAKDGRTLRGALLLPAGYQVGRQYPIIILIYAGDSLSDNLHGFGLRDSVRENLQVFAGRGYGVLAVDAPLQTHEPLREMPGLILPALDRLVELGIASCFGVMGHSYGGYSVNVLITQTDRFSAAVSSAGICDLVSFYLSVDADGTSSRMSWTEQAQGRMGGSLWEQRQRYIDNSPVFYLDRVCTPLLLLHGEDDPVIPLVQQTEIFAGLRRLGKRVSLVRYPGEGHGVLGLANVRDRWQRVLEWFDIHLARPPADAGSM